MKGKYRQYLFIFSISPTYPPIPPPAYPSYPPRPPCPPIFPHLSSCPPIPLPNTAHIPPYLPKRSEQPGPSSLIQLPLVSRPRIPPYPQYPSKHHPIYYRKPKSGWIISQSAWIRLGRPAEPNPVTSGFVSPYTVVTCISPMSLQTSSIYFCKPKSGWIRMGDPA